jgi:hypothetical protein
MPMKFRKIVLSGCKVMWKVCQNVIIAFYGVFSIGFIFVKWDLIRLRYMSTKFREPVLNGCKVMWKVRENVIIAFYGVFSQAIWFL